MTGFFRYFCGYAAIRVTGASPERCLNRMSNAEVRFWGLRREDELNYTFYVLQKDIPLVRRAANRTLSDAQVLRFYGLRQQFGGLKRRPVLIFGLLLALFFTFFLQRFVWTVEIQGQQTLHEEEILHALEELGIGPGTCGSAIDAQLTKHRMLNLLPELSWLAVNRSGGKLQVLVTERATPQSQRPSYAVANVIAARDGVLTEVSVLEGMKLCAAGQTVREGQLLVSGYEDYGLMVRAVCANAEIYALTWHFGTLVTPQEEYKKIYTGRSWIQRTLIIGRKRINLSGNSGIPVGNCDKMINEKSLSLPGGRTFRLALETAVYREYQLTASEAEKDAVRERLLKAWNTETKNAMLAGEIKNTSASLLVSNGLYVLHAESACREMIARIVPVEEIRRTP